MDRPYTQLSLDGRDKWWSLEEGTCECFERSRELSFAAWEPVVESYDAYVFFPGTLLGLDKTSCAVEANDQAACDFWIEGSTVTCLLNPVQHQHWNFVPIEMVTHRSMRLTQATTS